MPGIGQHVRDYSHPTPDRRAAYQRLLAATEETPASCDVNTLGEDWDKMKLADQRKVCRKCPVADLCLAYAETDPARTHGTWGGKKFPRRPTAVREAAKTAKQAQRAKRETP